MAPRPAPKATQLCVGVLICGGPVHAPNRLGGVCFAVGIEFRARNLVVGLGRIIRECSQFGVELQGANARGILVPDAMRGERLVFDGKREFAGLVRILGYYGKRVFPHSGLGFKSNVLNENVVGHFALPVLPATLNAVAGFLRRLERFGGVPSAGSTTMMLVTNFLMPCASKSIVVRSASVSVMTPQPY